MGLKGAKGIRKVSGKSPWRTPGGPLKLSDYGRREVRGMRGVAVKCMDIEQNSDCEGSVPAPD